jgi:GAF domain-containing protein
MKSAFYTACDYVGWVLIEASSFIYSLAPDDDHAVMARVICPIGSSLYSAGSYLYMVRP